MSYKLMPVSHRCHVAGKLCDPLVTHGPYMSALETGHNKVLYESTFFYFFTFNINQP